MSVGRFALCRPMALQETYIGFRQPHTASAVDLQLDAGVYGMLPALLVEFEALLQTEDSNMAVYLDLSTSSPDFGKVVLSTTTDTFRLDWSNASGDGYELRDALGFTGAISEVTSGSGLYELTADNISPYLWISSYGTSDRDVWQLKTGDLISGQTSRFGRFVGLKSGDDIYDRKLEITAEPAERILESRAGTEEEGERCLERFILQSLVETPTISGSPAPKGLYLFYDYGNLNSFTDYDTREGVQEILDTDPDLFCYCYAGSRGLQNIRAMVPGSMIYWQATLNLTRAIAPTWDQPT